MISYRTKVNYVGGQSSWLALFKRLLSRLGTSDNEWLLLFELEISANIQNEILFCLQSNLSAEECPTSGETQWIDRFCVLIRNKCVIKICKDEEVSKLLR